MTKREYLRSLGFEVGERGRFNEAMKKALEEYDGDFDVPTSNSAGPVGKPWIPFSDVPVRPSYALVGYTQYGSEVRFNGCRRCYAHMKYCICPDGILAPSIVVRSDDPLVCVSDPSATMSPSK